MLAQDRSIVGQGLYMTPLEMYVHFSMGGVLPNVF